VFSVPFLFRKEGGEMIQEFRCTGTRKGGTKCNRLLGYIDGYAEIKCSTCGKLNIFDPEKRMKQIKELMKNKYYDHTKVR